MRLGAEWTTRGCYMDEHGRASPGRAGGQCRHSLLLLPLPDDRRVRGRRGLGARMHQIGRDAGKMLAPADLEGYSPQKRLRRLPEIAGRHRGARNLCPSRTSRRAVRLPGMQSRDISDLAADALIILVLGVGDCLGRRFGLVGGRVVVARCQSWVFGRSKTVSALPTQSSVMFGANEQTGISDF